MNAVFGEGGVYLFRTRVPACLNGLKYSTVYPVTSQASPANSAVAIHFSNVIMLRSIIP